jgi:hypothetical protein
MKDTTNDRMMTDRQLQFERVTPWMVVKPTGGAGNRIVSALARLGDRGFIGNIDVSYYKNTVNTHYYLR